jgi:hypothetical protein
MAKSQSTAIVATAKVVPMKNAEPKKVAKKDQPWALKFRVGTIGRHIAEEIVRGTLTNDEIVSAVKKANAKAKTTYGCVAWYKSHARKAGVIE